MKKRLLLLCVCILLVSTSVCAAARDLNIVFIPKARDQDFWTFMRQGVELAVREAGNVRLTWRGPAHNDDVDSQIQILGLYTKAGVDAIIIVPTDRLRLVEPVKKAAALGIKIVAVDSALADKTPVNFISTDNHAAGRLAAERLAGQLPGPASVAVLRTVAGSASTDERADGFIEYMKKYAPRITIVADEYGGGTRGKSYHKALAMLEALPQVDGIFAVNESSSDGMLRALRQSGLAGKKKFVGFDTTDFLLDGLQKGDIYSLIIQNPRQMGYLGMKAAIAAAQGSPVKEPLVYTDAVAVTLDNLHNPEIRSLLVP
jgi:ribose transport system substrate-binding protein